MTAAGSRLAAPGITRLDRTRLDAGALYVESYDGLADNNSFQKNGLLTHRGRQYAAWHSADRSATVARRTPGAGAGRRCPWTTGSQPAHQARPRPVRQRLRGASVRPDRRRVEDLAYTDWTPLHDGGDLNAFGEVVIDETADPVGERPVLHAPGEVHRYDSLAPVRGRLRAVGMTVM